MGLLVSPSPADHVCDVPYRRALGLNGITSHTNHLTDTRHATIGDGAPERSIALVKLRRDEMLLPLRSAAGHTTKHGHIGT